MSELRHFVHITEHRVLNTGLSPEAKDQIKLKLVYQQQHEK
jgi:hypothetical protein